MAIILVVDDRPVNREPVVTLLGHAAYRLLEASDRERVLIVARQGHPDLIITSIAMPAMDDFEFARQLGSERGFLE
jgi:CheY-like chemotaxis protein